jgi:hypothetical protein
VRPAWLLIAVTLVLCGLVLLWAVFTIIGRFIA